MSIIIKGMDMPKNCFQCSFNDGIYCCLIDNDTEALIPKIPTDRLKDCPLIEINDIHYEAFKEFQTILLKKLEKRILEGERRNK